MSNIAFREACLEDFPRIVEMKVARFEEAGHASLLAKSAEGIVMDDYRRLYELNEAKHFVACIDKKIISCVGAFIKADLPYRYFEPSRYGFIGDVYTEPEERGRGLATALNKKALAWLKKRGVIMVRLLASNAGRKMYENLGFTSTDEMALKL